MIKAIKFEKPWDVACVEKEMPVPKKGEALIRVRSAGICGSDIGAKSHGISSGSLTSMLSGWTKYSAIPPSA